MATFLLGPRAWYAKYISIKLSNHIALVWISNYRKNYIKPYYSTLSGPIRASYGVFWDVIYIKLKLSVRSTRWDGSQHPDIAPNGRLWRNNEKIYKKNQKKNTDSELFFWFFYWSRGVRGPSRRVQNGFRSWKSMKKWVFEKLTQIHPNHTISWGSKVRYEKNDFLWTKPQKKQ